MIEKGIIPVFLTDQHLKTALKQKDTYKIVMIKFLSLASLIFLTNFVATKSNAQTLVFGELIGNPVSTTGWNLTGSAVVNGDEVILTPNVLNQSGTIYYNKPVNLGLCPQFTVEFEFRLFDGGGADGMVFCFLNQAPSGWVVGNVLGVPPTSAGLKVAFDTWDNGCNTRTPTIQILNSPNGYDECDPAMVRLNNSGTGSGVLGFMRKTDYTKARIVYNNGTVEVWLSKPTLFNPSPPLTLFLSTTISPINYAGYFGFSASTGGVSDKQSIRNVKIFSNVVPSIAGNDFTTCANQANVIGTTPDAANTYVWSPAQGLNQTDIANPTASIVNTSGVPITNEYIVTTYATVHGPTCVTKDTVKITTNPTFNTTQNAAICIGDSYTIGGQTFTTPGTHTVNLLSQFNCDSIITLNLAANPAPTSTFNQTVCFGESFFFNGTNYNTTGTYYATFPRPFGCDSVATLNLTVRNEILPSTNSITICQGDSYDFGGTSYNTAGNYVHTFSDLNGCDSVVTLNLDVVTSFTSTINPIICQGESYLFDGQPYASAGTAVATFQSIFGCDSVVTMNLTVNPTYNTVIDQSICQGANYVFNGQTYNATGSYNANLQTALGCDSIVTLNLNVTSSITNTVNQTICQGDTYNFNNQILNASGIYTATFPSVGGCDSLVTLNLLVTSDYSITLNEALCQGESYLFNGINYAVGGVYTANLQSVAGCDSLVTLNLVVNSIPATPQITSNSPLSCPGEEFVLKVIHPENTGAYLWTGPANYSGQGETVGFTTTGASVGIYSVVLQQDGCNSIAATEELFILGAEVTNFDFPNVISPNGDLVNDYLDMDQFFNACVPYDLIFWNRWGNVVYTQKWGEVPFQGYDQSGLKVSPGVYFYKLTYDGHERQGSITVVY